MKTYKVKVVAVNEGTKDLEGQIFEINELDVSLDFKNKTFEKRVEGVDYVFQIKSLNFADNRLHSAECFVFGSENKGGLISIKYLAPLKR
jgi:hypothetical protein